MGPKNILLASFVIFLIAYLGFALAQNVVLIATLFIVYGLYQGIFRAVGKALAADFVPEHLRASGVGWYSTTVGLLQLVASVVAGLLWDRIGHAAVFYYGAVFAVVGGIALSVLVPVDDGRANPRGCQAQIRRLVHDRFEITVPADTPHGTAQRVKVLRIDPTVVLMRCALVRHPSSEQPHARYSGEGGSAGTPVPVLFFSARQLGWRMTVPRW